MLERRYGPRANDAVFAMIADAGLPAAREKLTKVPNGGNALIVAQLARERPELDELLRLVFEAYWAEARDISDPDVLVELAERAGLDGEEVRAAIADGQGFDEVVRWTNEAYGAGVTGVPAWVVDERLLIPGAQPHELFERVLVKLGHEPAADAP